MWLGSTEGPMWGHPMLVLGAFCSFLEPFCGHLSPKNDKVSEELTLRYPLEGPCVDKTNDFRLRKRHRSGAEGPLPSEYGTRKTVKARFWPWLPGKRP